MAKKSVPAPAPLTFELPLSLLDKMESHRKRLGLGSISEVVRHALAEFDLARYESEAEEKRQISVRIPAQTKTSLMKSAKRQKASVGELVRAAVESLPSKKAKK